MSFPENLKVPARTVMATMSASSRESMILKLDENRYRLPTVRETASMMSFPIDYKFYGESKGIKHTLVGNAVPPKLSYAIARAIAVDAGVAIPEHYIPIQHNPEIPFINLNGRPFPRREEREKRIVSKFKYHIPYLIFNAYRVELTNYHSDFDKQVFTWDVEIHYSQGKERAAKFTPNLTANLIPEYLHRHINAFLEDTCGLPISFTEFQKVFCMTEQQRTMQEMVGPYELLGLIRDFIHSNLSEDEHNKIITINQEPYELPQAILLGAFIIKKVLQRMDGV